MADLILFRYRATYRKPNVLDDNGDPVVYEGDEFSLRFPVEVDGRPFKIDPSSPSAIRQAIRRAAQVERKHHPILPDTQLEVCSVRLVGQGIR